MIHTIGDSHCYSGWNKGTVVHHIGPMLCYTFSQSPIDISSFHILDDDVVIFSFGEIDCRCHVNKHITDTRTYKDVISDLVDNYIAAVKSYNMKYAYIYNIVPPVKRENVKEDSGYPFVGTNEERKMYVEYFNKLLLERYDRVVYTYNDYVDKDGYLDMSKSDGSVHVSYVNWGQKE